LEKITYDQLYNVIRRGHNRKDRKSSAIEEYLETIHELEKIMGWVRIKDLSKMLNVRPSSVTKAIKKLHSEGLVIYERYRGVRLSELGIETVHKLGRKHKILAELLKEAGLEEIEAQVEAERLEHIIPDNLIEYLEKLLKKYREIMNVCRENRI
jgi:Mn-dependent DtxR family transcriptional regulator